VGQVDDLRGVDAIGSAHLYQQKQHKCGRFHVRSISCHSKAETQCKPDGSLASFHRAAGG
jgi:hypothetical protein